jgi:S-DNA-T family DNA segregation ATPase FtsK/SpoIIIE
MSKYKIYSVDQTEELLSNYLIDSWSYSKVRTFACNEKAFEMQYVYNEFGKSSSTTIAGQAYHKSLESYFLNLKEGVVSDLVTLEQIAFDYIDNVKANYWKIQKTTPTIEECRIKATKLVSQLLNNFMSEIEIYQSEIKEVICAEIRLTTWLTINGVDIPLPCHMVIDLVIRTNDGKLVIIDHKSKVAFTDEAEIKFSIGKQAIIYALGYESEFGEKIDEVWYIENKTSVNRDKSDQLVLSKSIMDESTMRLYEAMIYEPLKRMIEAVSNPDYVYMINDNDNMTDKAELYEFWAKTMISEIEEFNISEKKKPLIKERLRKMKDASLATITPTVIKNFKAFTEQFIPYDFTNKNMTNQEKTEHVLRSFGIIVKVQHVFEGYSSTSFLLEINAGVPIASISRYKLDIANALGVANIRIYKDLFVYEGKSYLALESGKKHTDTLVWDKSKLEGNKIPLGIDNFQQTVYWDLDNNSTPHMLVCGATGSGKSVFIRSIIEYAKLGVINDIYIMDPKHEFKAYNGFGGINVINEIEDIELQMMLLVEEMENRVRSQQSYKTLIIFDEFADAVANSRKGNDLKNYSEEIIGNYANRSVKTKRVVVGLDKSLEENLRILLQKGRSVGFRIIAATQRASTKVITGDAKVNFPVQVCFRVPKDIDSMVVIDEPGAESLNGRGDGLIKSPEYLNVVRFQAFYKS